MNKDIESSVYMLRIHCAIKKNNSSLLNIYIYRRIERYPLYQFQDCMHAVFAMSVFLFWGLGVGVVSTNKSTMIRFLLFSFLLYDLFKYLRVRLTFRRNNCIPVGLEITFLYGFIIISLLYFKNYL